MNGMFANLYPAPPNEFGIVGCSIPLTYKEWKAMLDGPIAAVEPDYQAEIKKPVDLFAGFFRKFLWRRRN